MDNIVNDTVNKKNKSIHDKKINEGGEVLRSMAFPEKYLKCKDFMVIFEILINLYMDGVLQKSHGCCLSTSDMILKLLHTRGIKSQLVECSLTLTTEYPPSLNFIGYNRLVGMSVSTDNPNVIDSHVVLITETDIPFLIDCSCGIYDKELPFILTELNPTEQASLCEVKYKNSHWMYEYKNDNRIPRLHQQSILKRIETDKKLFNKIDAINKILLIVIAVTSLNFIRGGYDFYQKFIVKDNGFGPNQIIHK